MFKKYNQYLLTHYPLLWNLKYPWILLTLLIFHLLALIFGYLSGFDKTILKHSNFESNFFPYLLFFFLIAFVTLIIWIRFYIKNNRLKSSYPITKKHLFGEFFGVFSIFIILCFIPSSFLFGLRKKLSSYVTTEQYFKDIDIINRANPFVLYGADYYSMNSRDISVPVFDQLVTEKETKVLYQHNKEVFEKENKERNEKYPPYRRPYFKNNEFIELLLNHFPNRKSIFIRNLGLNYNGYDYEYKNMSAVIEAEAAIYDIEGDTINISEKLLSLYNYNHVQFNDFNDKSKNKLYYSKELIKLLQKNNKNEIKEVLDGYTQLLDKFKVDYRFKKKIWIDRIPNPPYYFIDEFISSYEDENTPIDYIKSQHLYNVYKNIGESKFNCFYFTNTSFYILLSTVLAIILITFRLTSFKVWLISIIASGILLIVISLLSILLEFVFSQTSIGLTFEYASSVFYFLFYFSFIFICLYNLRNNQSKIITGVILNLSFTMSVFFFIIVTYLISHIYQTNFMKIQGNDYNKLKEDPTFGIIQNFSDVFTWLNPILVIVSFYFFISKLYKKWQAMPEQ